MFASCMVTTAVNTCNSSYFYCVNTTHYQQCVGTSLTTMNHPQECKKLPNTEVACSMLCTDSCAVKTDSCQNFKCVEKGKFANPNNCKEYFICSLPQGATKYVRNDYKCPINTLSYFNSDSKLCVLTDSVCETRPL